MELTTRATDITCPYCGEQFELIVDPSVPSQTYVEDCYICCAPINLTVEVDTDLDQVYVLARHENEC